MLEDTFINKMGEVVDRRYADKVSIDLLEDCPPFYPTNAYLSYVYMVPSTKDTVFKYDDGQIVVHTIGEFGGYETSCLGRLYERMTDEERTELEPNLDKLIQLLEGL